MLKKLLALTMLMFLAASTGAMPVVTLGPPIVTASTTFDPGSIQVEMLSASEVVDVRLSMTIHPVCVRPVAMGLTVVDDGGTFSDQTGALINGCNGDTSVFDIRLTGDGSTHIFHLMLVDLDSGYQLASIPVFLYTGVAPVITMGPPVSNAFITVDPGLVRVEMLGSDTFVDVRLSAVVHPFCIMPIQMGVGTVDDDGTFTDLTGALLNACGGDISEFDVRLTGDGLAHGFDITLWDLTADNPLATVPVELFPGVADTDGDGISDLSDNCTEIPNSDQRDTNDDGYGNACDPDINNDGIVAFLDIAGWVPLFNTATTGDADFDGNGVANFLDYALFPQYFLGPPGPSALAP